MEAPKNWKFSTFHFPPSVHDAPMCPNTIMATLRGGGGIKVLKMYYVVCDWSLIGLRKRTGCKGQQKIECLQIVVTKLEDECNFISNFFVRMHFTGQKKKLNDVTHTVSYLWAFPAEPHPPIIFVLLLFIFAWQARLLLSLLCSFLIWRNLSENSHEIYIA